MQVVRALVLVLGGCQYGQVNGANGHLIVSPDTVDFGTTPVGTTSELRIQLRNAGHATISAIDVALTASSDVALSQVLTTNCDGTVREDISRKMLGGNTCATILVQYTPSGETTLTGAVIIASSDSDHPVLSIPLTGRGVAGTIQVCLVDPMTGTPIPSSCFPSTTSVGGAPPIIAFGAWAVGTAAVRTVRVFNHGTFPLDVTDAHIEASVADFSLIGGLSVSPVVAPGESTDIQVQFKPQVDSEESGSLVISSNDLVNPTVSLPITAQSLGPKLCAMPDPVDFGTVPNGSSRTIHVTLSNCGIADETITQLALFNNAPSATVFTTPAPGTPNAHSIPTFPLAFPTGATLTIDVIYSPDYVETPPVAGDSGYLQIQTSFQRSVVPVQGRGGFPGCDANGLDLAPTAVVAVEDSQGGVDPTATTFNPLTSLVLDATGSTAPAAGTITGWTWSIVAQPQGSVASIIGSGSKVGVFLELVGDYVVELVVSTGQMCQSAPLEVALHVRTNAALHVQLTWPQAFGDQDLHYIGPGGAFYETSPFDGDLDWEESLATAYGAAPPTPTGKTPPDWGGPGTYPNGGGTVAPDGSTADDASLDCDQRQGYGPENLTHNEPFDGTYRVTVHYFCSDDLTGGSPDLGPTTAMVSIFVHGALAFQGSMPRMHQTQAWDVADIVVANGGTDITVVPLETSTYATTQGCVDGYFY
jgi:hypothetical protein